MGLNLALELAKDNYVIGHVHSQHLVSNSFTVIQGDLLAAGEVQRLLDETKPDWIIHCAALANVDACESDPLQAQQLNTEIPQKLAHYVARGGARLLHVSTDAVFDGEHGGYSEDDKPNPLSIYARTKLQGEQGVARENPDAIIARVNLFGWSLSGNRSLAEFFFNNLRAGTPVMGFTDVYFCPVLANHLAGLFCRMLEAELSGIYHVVGSDCISKYHFGRDIARQFGFDESLIDPNSVANAGLPAARSPNLTLSNEKLIHDIGSFPPNLSTGIRRFYTLYQQGYPQKIRKLVSEAYNDQVS